MLFNEKLFVERIELDVLYVIDESNMQPKL